MTALRSYLGCEVCRQRKLKCDEVKPQCGPCQKGLRQCRFSGDAIFRAKHFVPANFYPDDHVWVEVPGLLRFVHIEDPYEGEGSQDLTELRSPLMSASSPENQVSPGHDSIVEALPDLQSHHQLATWTPLEIDTGDPSNEHISTGQTNRSCDSTQHGPPEAIPSAAIGSIDDKSILELHLRQYFKNGPAHWMDIFDSSAYFSSRVPIIAINQPLLRAAISALSAKCLLRMQTRGHALNLSSSFGSSSSLFQLPNDVDLNYQSADYYHQALGYLKAATNNRDLNSDSDDEALFAAVTVLSFYELMDAPGVAWRAHLSALPLFSSPSGMYSLSTRPHSVARAVFWNLVRQDVLCAIISETQTRLNLEDVYLWQSAAVAAGGTSVFLPPGDGSASQHPLYPPAITAAVEVEESIRSNELMWLLGKIVNHLTIGDALTPEEYAKEPGERLPLGVTQTELKDRWLALSDKLEKWRQSLPATFVPVARADAPTPGARPSEDDPVGGSGQQDWEAGPSHDGNNEDPFEKVWYEVPMCAATMQNYHMARILLLVNQPMESTAVRSTVSSRLHSYRSAQRRAMEHAREICAISSSGLPASVRIHSVQALFVAGQTFFQRREQTAVIRLLEGIEEDLGWATGFHIRKLVDEWAAN